jgi:hypothetical protein
MLLIIKGREGNVSMVPIKDGQENGIQGPQVCSLPVGSMPELHFVPRKRTNTNHVITPKIKMRQTTLDRQAQPLAERVNGSSTPTKRPRKSIRKSLLAGMAENIAEQKSIRINRQRSSDFDPSLHNKYTDSNNQIREQNLGEGSGTRRRLRRSTSATRHSILHIDLPIESQDTESHGAERTPADVLTTLAPEPSNGSTSMDTITVSLLETACLKISFMEPDFDTATVALPNMELSNDKERSQPHTEDTSKVPTLAENPDLMQSVRPPISTDTHGTSEHVQNVAKETFPVQQITILSQAAETSDQQETILDVDDSVEELVGHSHLIEDCDTGNEKQASSALDEGASVQNDDVLSPLTSEGSGSTESNKEYLESGDSTMQASSEIVNNHGDKEKVKQGLNSDPDTNSSSDTPLSSSATSTYDHDDTDMLRNFLTRVKANKAARKSPRRKRSLPHSPLRLPLGTLDNNLSPSPLRPAGETETTEPSPVKGKRKGSAFRQEGVDLEPRSIRRSGRTRLPVKEPPAVPSFIPVRRLGQDLDTTITLKRSEEKELAALTRVNTRKNKGNALSAMEVLTRKAEEKEDPAMRQRLLKEVFEEKMEKSKQNKDKKGREKKVVTWAEEIAQFQNLTKGKVEAPQEEQEKEKSSVVPGGEEKKSSAVRVGVRSKGALGGSLNGTPEPKRKMRGVVV